MPDIAGNSVCAEQKSSKDLSCSTERRQSRRKGILKAGYATYNNAGCSLPVIVRDLSDTGAKITVESMAVLPQHFSLHVELEGFRVECECVWRKQRTYGVRFCGPREATRIVRRQVLTPTSGQFHVTIDEVDPPTLPVCDDTFPVAESGGHETGIDDRDQSLRRQVAFGRLRLPGADQ